MTNPFSRSMWTLSTYVQRWWFWEIQKSRPWHDAAAVSFSQLDHCNQQKNYGLLFIRSISYSWFWDWWGITSRSAGLVAPNKTSRDIKGASLLGNPQNKHTTLEFSHAPQRQDPCEECLSVTTTFWIMTGGAKTMSNAAMWMKCGSPVLMCWKK